MASSSMALISSPLSMRLPNYAYSSYKSSCSCNFNKVSHSTLPRQTKLNGFSGGGESDKKDGQKKKFITREQEPEQYWQTQAERDGVNPMTTPLPYIVILGFLTPFIILGIAFANNWVKMPVR